METKKFVDVFCSQCGLCEDHKLPDFTAAFCIMKFDDSPGIFTEETFTNLLIHSANIGCGKIEKFTIGHLEDAFCKPGVCFDGDMALVKSCEDQRDCLKMMREQMGKSKKKKHHKRSPENYSKQQFLGVICKQCGICKEGNCNFCYKMYRKAPKSFINRVFLDLIKYREESESFHITSDMSVADFCEIFCDGRICFNTEKECNACDKFNNCHDEFLDQKADITDKKPSKRQRKKMQQSYVCAPYASFFMRKNDSFQKEVKRIFNGDNPIEQNKGEELPIPDPATDYAGASD